MNQCFFDLYPPLFKHLVFIRVIYDCGGSVAVYFNHLLRFNQAHETALCKTS